ncbi:hypothetical protein CGRA01v4_08000 [Colletotrichum graminicola]|nr:hypothetical protein CGRA01v4_08000 [Colletotrichum graminicola]
MRSRPPISGRKLNRRYPSFPNPSRRKTPFPPILELVGPPDTSPPASNYSRGEGEGRTTSVGTALVLLVRQFIRLFA